MEKRTIIALVLMVIILFFFQTYFAPKQQPKQPQATEGVQTKETPQAKDEKIVTKTAKSEAAPAPAKKTERPLAKVEKRDPKDVYVETPYLKVTLTDLGGGIRSVWLKKYKETVKGTRNKEVIEDVKPFIYIPKISDSINNETIDDRTYFKPDRENITITDKPETLTFTGTLEDGKKVRKIYTFHPDSYLIDMKAEFEITDKDKTAVEFAVISGKKESSYVFKGPFVYNGKKLEQIDKIEKTMDFSKNYTYAGFDDGFFAFIWIPDEGSKPPLSIYKTDSGTPVVRLSPDKGTLSGKLFFGPKQSDVLKSLNVKAEKIIDFGWFDIIAKPLIMFMNFTYRFTHNYGIDIIILTILIKIIFYPLSVKSYKSMKEMQKLQPMVAKLKEKYKNDRAKLNQEMMGLYKTRGVNPMGGCLPMVIQIPVFFALYKALSGAIELRHAPFFWWINDLSAPEDLFSFVIPGIGFTVPVRILPLIMGITQVIQQKMTPTSADPLQEKMMLFMPIFFTFLFWGFPAGLVLYWLVNNVISIGQQYYINKKVT
ncbi:MAG: Membrane protein insertase YidC [Syntrophorhabdus sp. PtaU1.Bin058]|nr:MAG: Membrane protein insertase YidC [Syntrophorhabdus sp. PtaU1.Bin058]